MATLQDFESLGDHDQIGKNNSKILSGGLRSLDYGYEDGRLQFSPYKFELRFSFEACSSIFF
jgi:hypothetical protein